jgi:uncharacterized membrane-anchored protein
MQTRHVPAIGPYYWSVFAVATIFGANMGDFLSQFLGLGSVGGMPILAFFLLAVLILERLDDRSDSKAWYWAAIVLIPIAASNLGDFAVAHGYSRRWMLAGLAILLIITHFGGRSESEHMLAMRLLTRPGQQARPLTDASYWVGMIVASTLGPLISDFCSYTLKLGPFESAAILLGLLATSFGLHYLPNVSRWLVHWLTIVLIRGAGTAIADVLVNDPRVHIGLLASTALAGVATLLLLMWPVERSARREPLPR